MKILFPILSLFIALTTFGQSENEKIYRKGDFYFSQEGEIIFSFANINADSMNTESILRWSPVFNFMPRVNYDFTKIFGIDIGLGFRNVGFIAKFPDAEENLKIKYRTYNLGLPIGIKIGDLEQNNPFFFFGGYELEMPFHFKQKRFEDGDKVNKITGYFSKRTERFTQSAYAGVQFRNGFSLKFKYYLDGFFNQDFKEFKHQPDGSRLALKPYAGFDANVFYFSITWYPFQDTELLINTKDDKENETVTALKFR